MQASPDTSFWFLTRKGDAAKVTLHRSGCRIHMREGNSKGWTGPLTIEQVAIVPPDSYDTCRLCHSDGPLPAKPRTYGPRKVYSPYQRWRVKNSDTDA